MTKKLILYGFLVECDSYNRLKLMFISDYSSNATNTLTIDKDFTKDYITKKNNYYKSKNPNSYCPISDDKYFYIKSKKNQKGLMNINKLEYLHETEPHMYQIFKSSAVNGVSNVSINYLLQNLVKCIVEVNDYKFKLNDNTMEGYNFKLIQISLMG